MRIGKYIIAVGIGNRSLHLVTDFRTGDPRDRPYWTWDGPSFPTRILKKIREGESCTNAIIGYKKKNTFIGYESIDFPWSREKDLDGITRRRAFNLWKLEKYKEEGLWWVSFTIPLYFINPWIKIYL